MPFWQEVYRTERRAGAIVKAFEPQVSDPVMREAVALQGKEEAQYAKLIRVMIDRYGLDATEQRGEPSRPNSRPRSSTSASARSRLQANRSSARGHVRDLRRADAEETRHTAFLINYMACREKRRGHVFLTRALKPTWLHSRAARRLLGMV